MEIPELTNQRRSLCIAAALVTAGVVLRLLPHEANFAPVAAIALFGGAVLGARYALGIPLAIMILSDWLIGFYAGMGYVWAAYILIALYGILLRRSRFSKRIILGGLGATLLFYLVSNFGVWAIGYQYPPTLAGLVQSYYMALPFVRASLLSDVMYSFVLFGSLELYTYARSRQQSQKQVAST